MNSGQFKAWLAKQVCTFEEQAVRLGPLDRPPGSKEIRIPCMVAAKNLGED
jgi:hypothetical protein